MTRQKKEIIKHIDEIENFIAADEELGCGFAPAGFYEPLEQEAWNLREELARLMHYDNAMEMMMDPRGCHARYPEIPFV